MKRREVLAIVAAGAVPLAGCSGDGGGGSDDSDGDGSGGSGTGSGDDGSSSSTDGTANNATDQGLVWEGWSVPEEVGVGEEVTLEATIANTSDESQTFEITTFATIPDGQEQQVDEPSTYELAAGVTRTFGSPGTLPYVGTWEYRLEITGVENNPTVQIEVVPAQFAIGGTFTTLESVSVSARELRRTTEYNYENFRGETQTQQAPDGRAYMWVTFRSSNQSNQSQYVPTDLDVSLLHEDSQYDSSYIDAEQGRYEGGEIQPGVRREGWIAYEVPADISPDDVTIAYSGANAYGDWLVRWSR